jgi:hypothetical protein
VLAARTALGDLADRLEAPAAVEPGGAAMVMCLLCEGAGPLYARCAPGELGRVAAAAHEALGARA